MTVFVGIPTINRPDLVQETVESVRRQTYEDYRVVVSDNCSDEAVQEQVRTYVEGLNDRRFSFHAQPENVGEYGQGRYFLSVGGDADYFVILHDDDVLEPGYLEAAVSALSDRQEFAFFVANPYLMDRAGKADAAETRSYLARHGRLGRPAGEIDVLSTHMRCGFTPISGTCFRTSALLDSGFVDGDCFGNFPFELNVFLRLGEIGARAWFDTRTLLGIRFHRESLRNYLKLTDNPEVVGTMIKLLARRRFEGRNERRRRAILSRLHRAMALILVRGRDAAGARSEIRNALAASPWSVRLWATAPLVLVAPSFLRRLSPGASDFRNAPRLPVDKRS